jgi:hypothetical protein
MINVLYSTVVAVRVFFSTGAAADSDAAAGRFFFFVGLSPSYTSSGKADLPFSQYQKQSRENRHYGNSVPK